MKTTVRKGIALFAVAFLVAGCTKAVPADANIIDVNASLAKGNEVNGQYPVEALTLNDLIEKYPSAVFVNAEGSIVTGEEDLPYSAGESEYFIGPVRISAYYKGASSVKGFSNEDMYVKGAKLSWLKSLRHGTKEILQYPAVQPEIEIKLASDQTVAVYILPLAYLDDETNQYAVIKDDHGYAKGLWAVIPES
ncbi:MAG: hypothetical protein PUE98_03175 [Galactobacillus timonensis]|uniref:hypothetical protein n=1 Tax=Galactobacillus timonensis TaxID=2041840 RepID=UPI00240A21CD|nr:hypothetical protein [Galactobacillus timonensis]MDD6599453.1 hypothetical protein [Galactobacillus timonensis]